MKALQGSFLLIIEDLLFSQVTNLRVEMRQAGIEYRVLKNTMVKRAADEIGLDGLEPFLKGPYCLSFFC